MLLRGDLSSAGWHGLILMAGGWAEMFTEMGLDLGVEEFGEAGVVGHVLEVGVGAGLDAVAGVLADGLGEVLEAGVRVAGHAGEDGEAVEGVVGLVVGLEDGLELLAGVFVVAVVEQGDGVVVALFGVGEGGLALGDLLEAGVDVHADAVGEVAGAGGEHLVEGCRALVVFARLHEAECGLVVREGLGAVRCLRMGVGCRRGSGGAFCSWGSCCLRLCHIILSPLGVTVRYGVGGQFLLFVLVSVLYAEPAPQVNCPSLQGFV